MTLACGCPETWPDWHEQDQDVGGLCVHKLPIPMFMHMPLAFELYAARQHQAVEQLGLSERWPGLAFMQTGALRGALVRFIENTTSPSQHIHYLPRPFQVRARLHQGGVGTMRKPLHEMQMTLAEEGRIPKQIFLAHLTCPQCSEARGGDQMLLLRRWTPSATLQERVRNA